SSADQILDSLLYLIPVAKALTHEATRRLRQMEERRERSDASPQQGCVHVVLLSGKQVGQCRGSQTTSAFSSATSKEWRSDVRAYRARCLLSRLLHALLLFFQPCLAHLGRGPEESVPWVVAHFAQELRRHLRQFRQCTSRQRRRQEASAALHQIRAHV